MECKVFGVECLQKCNNDCARNAGAEHRFTPAYRIDHYLPHDYKNNYRGLPPNVRKPNSSLWT